MPTRQVQIYGLILSAGLSGRMEKFKPLYFYNNKSFIQNIVLRLNTVCDKIIIVTGYKSNKVEENVKMLNLGSKIQLSFNPAYKTGMFTSLQTGLNSARNSNWVLYHFVDQPGLPANFYSDFIKQIDEMYNWIQPSFRKQGGHPILIHKSLFDLIRSAPQTSSLREISKNPLVKKKLWECKYEDILQDIDTPEDLNNLGSN